MDRAAVVEDSLGKDVQTIQRLKRAAAAEVHSTANSATTVDQGLQQQLAADAPQPDQDTELLPVAKRVKADAGAQAHAAADSIEQPLAEADIIHLQEQIPAAPQQQHSEQHLAKAHLRKHHSLSEDDDKPTAAETAGSETTTTAADGGQSVHDLHNSNEAFKENSKQEQQQGDVHSAAGDKPAGHHHKHKRSSTQARKQQHLLSFQDEEEGDEQTQLPSAAAEDGATGTAVAAAGSTGAAAAPAQHKQPQVSGSLGQATAARFKQEAKQAAAARFTFHPASSKTPDASQEQQQQQLLQEQGKERQGLGIVDDDCSLPQQAPAGLSQIHFGMAQARGARPYMEDRHCIVTALRVSNNPHAASSPHAAHLNGTSAAAAADTVVHRSTVSTHGPELDHIQQQQQQQQQGGVTGVVHDGVGRCYAAIFDGHNGAGAAETAARQLHLVLAGHPALRIYKGDPGPPAAVQQEEAAVSKALKAAFRHVDDLVLAVARREGTRDGATALVVLRLGGTLYAAHAGDSRAVLCREGLAHRLTEDHKPHLPQERQRIEDAGGRVDFQRCWRVVVEPKDGRPGSGLAVSRSLGDLDFKEPARFVECDPDVTRLVMQPHKDSFVILGSDGLWDVLSDTDAVSTAAAALKAYSIEHKKGSNSHTAAAAAVNAATSLYSQHVPYGREQQQQQGRDLQQTMVYSDAAATAAAEALLAESMRRGTMDNVTVIVMLLQWE